MRVSVPFAALAVIAVGAVGPAAPAYAMTMKECSAQYKAAKSSNNLAGKSWNDFRKSECGSPSSGAAPTTTAAAAPAAKKPAVVSSAAAGAAIFPQKVGAAYANEKPGKARMHTCLDQYRANKTTNANGGMRWIQVGGGYYSACNARLKS